MLKSTVETQKNEQDKITATMQKLQSENQNYKLETDKMRMKADQF